MLTHQHDANIMVIEWPTNHTLVICKSTNRTTANRQQVVTTYGKDIFQAIL